MRPSPESLLRDRRAVDLSDRFPPIAAIRLPPTIADANHTAGVDAFAESVSPAIREAQAAGAKTLRQIAVAMNGRGIGTARRRKWEAMTVANVLRRIG